MIARLGQACFTLKVDEYESPSVATAVSTYITVIKINHASRMILSAVRLRKGVNTVLLFSDHNQRLAEWWGHARPVTARYDVSVVEAYLPLAGLLLAPDTADRIPSDS